MGRFGSVLQSLTRNNSSICSGSHYFQTHNDLKNRWGPNNFATESVSHCDQAALVSCRVVALLRKGPYGDAAKKVAEFGQAGMI